MGKRRGVRRFLFALALLPTAAGAQDVDKERVRPVVERMLRAEADLAQALAARDVVGLHLLSWRINAEAFEIHAADPPIKPDDPAAVVLRRAYVRCADAHSPLSFVALSASRALQANESGEGDIATMGTESQGIGFFLKPHHERRAQCRELSGIDIPPPLLGPDAKSILPSPLANEGRRLTAEDKAVLQNGVAALGSVEEIVAQVFVRKDGSRLPEALGALHAVQTVIVRRTEAANRRDAVALRECRWANAHIFGMLESAQKSLVRPAIRDNSLTHARDSLRQYPQAKADCAAALGLPQAAGAVTGIKPDDLAQ